MCSENKLIRKIATQVRAELEKFCNINNTKHFNALPCLGGLCGYGSAMLYEALTKYGFSPQIARGQGHWFVICEGLLVDVTASQFGQPSVVVRDYKKVKEGIHSQKYLMAWWDVDNLYSTLCGAGLCQLKDEIDAERNYVAP